MIWHGSGTKRPERLTNGKSPGGRQGLSPGLMLGTRDNQIRQGSGIADLRPGNLTEQPGPWFDRVRNLTPEREIGVLGCGPDRVGVAQLLVVELQPDRVRHACATGQVHRHETAQEAAYALDPLEIGVSPGRRPLLGRQRQDRVRQRRTDVKVNTIQRLTAARATRHMIEHTGTVREAHPSVERRQALRRVRLDEPTAWPPKRDTCRAARRARRTA